MIIRAAPPDDDDDVNANATSNSRSRVRSGSNASAEQHKVKDALPESSNDGGGGGAGVGEDSPSRDNKTDGAAAARGSASSSPANQSMSICWFEDGNSGLALRWHLFAGTLFDLSRRNSTGSSRRASSSATTAAAAATLPWKIRVHFTSYPTNQILSFDTQAGVMQSIERYYMNSLKQALFLQHGSSRVAMNICKADHRKLWDAVVASNCSLYAEVNSELQAEVRDETGGGESGGGGGGGEGGDDWGELQSIPVRVLVDGKPAVQRLCPPFRRKFVDDSATTSSSSSLIPTTLGDVLLKFIPSLFERKSTADRDGDGQETESNEILSSVVPTESLTWIVQGLDGIPLTFPLGQIWRSLSCPDHFLYVVLLTA